MEAAEQSGEPIEEDGIFCHRPHDIRQKAKYVQRFWLHAVYLLVLDIVFSHFISASGLESRFIVSK